MKNPSFDLNVRYLDFDGRKIEIDYISSLCSDELIAYFGLKKRAIINANKMAEEIPAAVKSNIPIARPKTPYSFVIAMAPCIKEWPKLVMGSIAPA